MSGLERIRRLIQPKLEQLGWEHQNADEENVKEIRRCLFRILGEYGIAGVSEYVCVNRFMWLEELEGDDSFEQLARLKLGLYASPEPAMIDVFWQQMQQIAENAFGRQRHNILNAIGYVQDIYLKLATLKWAESIFGFQSGEMWLVVKSVAYSGQAGSDVVWDWLLNKWIISSNSLDEDAHRWMFRHMMIASRLSTDISRADKLGEIFGSSDAKSCVELIRAGAADVEQERGRTIYW